MNLDYKQVYIYNEFIMTSIINSNQTTLSHIYEFAISSHVLSNMLTYMWTTV